MLSLEHTKFRAHLRSGRSTENSATKQDGAIPLKTKSRQQLFILDFSGKYRVNELFWASPET